MSVSLSVFKENPGKYFELAKTTDIIVTKRGRRLGRIVGEENASKSDRLNAFDELMRCVKTMPSAPDDFVYDECKEQRLREKGLL